MGDFRSLGDLGLFGDFFIVAGGGFSYFLSVFTIHFLLWRFSGLFFCILGAVVIFFISIMAGFCYFCENFFSFLFWCFSAEGF